MRMCEPRIIMLLFKRSHCWIVLLLSCGGAVESEPAPASEQAAPAQHTSSGGVGGAAGSGGGPYEPAAPSSSSPPPSQPGSVDLPDGTLATAQAWPVALALDATHVYWANWGGYGEGSIQRIAKLGGSAEVLARSANRPDSLALDQEHAYFAERVLGTLSRVPLAGGEPEQVVDNVNDLAWALADETIYFLSYSSEGIQGMSKHGGDRQTAIPSAKASGQVYVHSGYVYWSEQFFPNPSSFDDHSLRLWRAALAGGQPELLVNEPGSILSGFAVDDRDVYYGLVGVLPECGCEGTHLKALAQGSAEPRTLVTVQGSHIGALSVDSAHIYWATSDTIHRTSKDGASTVTLASDLPWVSAIATDDEHLYVTLYDESGSVRRLAK
ncbi:MAG: hypothetical protein RL685_348 [Pseudomonadota bacterium]|jgi:hypothetical protein